VQFVDPSGTHASGYFRTTGFTQNSNDATPVSVPPNATGIDIQLPPGYSISGTVTGPGGTPLPDVWVDACDSTCGGASTAADGTYTVGGLASGAYTLQFHDPSGHAFGFYGTTGFTPNGDNASPVNVPPNASGIDVQLPLGYSISGRVTGPGGIPLPGINVNACPDAGGPCYYSDTTAADGTYTHVDLIPAGSYRVQFSDPNATYVFAYYTTTGSTPNWSDATLVSVPPNASGIDVQLLQGFNISGMVTGLGNAPLANVWVCAWSTDGGSCDWTLTAADGTYRTGALVAGSHKVQFYPNGTYANGYYSATGFTSSWDLATPINVPPNASGINVQLPLAFSISGTVRGSGGAPLANVLVEACLSSAWGCDDSSIASSVSTAVDGTYTISDIAAGTYKVSFQDSGHVYATGYYATAGYTATWDTATQVSVPPSLAGINVQLPVGYKISGTVTGPGATPLLGINVIACDWFCTVASTAANGTYSLGGLAVGSYTVQFDDPSGTYAFGFYSAAGLVHNWAAATPISVPPSRTGINVQLPLTGATYYSLTPARMLDTRDGTGLTGKFTSATPRSLAVSGHNGVPATAIAVTGNLTVTGQSSPGFAALTTVSTPAPTTSTLNFPLGDNRANGVTAPLGPGGVLWMTYMGQVGGATTDLIFDVTGYFLP
jgi:hypothetical protein